MGDSEGCIARLSRTGVGAAIDAAVELGAPQVIYVVRITLSEGVRLSSEDVIPLLFRRGVTPDDVYSYLKDSDDTRLRARGIYVRAEAIGPSGKRTVLKKDQVLDDSTCCIKIFTNRARAGRAMVMSRSHQAAPARTGTKEAQARASVRKGGQGRKTTMA